MKIGHRIWFEQQKRVFGKGPAQLLQVVEQTKSLREAARQLDLSYTKAFHMIKQAERELGYPLLIRTIGGVKGGGSSLSDQAKQLIANYQALDEAIAAYAQAKQCQIEQERLEQFFATFLSAGLISLIGGGGKTTIVNWLTRQRAKTGRTLLTSTTNMFQPDFLAVDYKVVTSRANPSALFSEYLRDDKLKGIPPEQVDQLKAEGQFDSIIVEADGSKGLPIKAYGHSEPPIPQTSELVILVLGADGFSQTIEQAVHRPEIYAAATQAKLSDRVTADNYLKFFHHPEGSLKNVPDCPVVIVLNRIDQMSDRTPLIDLIPGFFEEPRVAAVLLTQWQQGRLEASFTR